MTVEIEQIAPHLWWWTAPHPDWGPDAFKDGQGWQRGVSSYAIVEGDDLVLFDPLVPVGQEERFWEALDRDVQQHGPPQILLTVFWHARSSREILERYGGAGVWAHEPSAAEVEQRVPVAHAFSEGDRLPGGVEPIAMHHMDEAAFWLPSHRALLVGDCCSVTRTRCDSALRAGCAMASRRSGYARRRAARWRAGRSGSC